MLKNIFTACLGDACLGDEVYGKSTESLLIKFIHYLADQEIRSTSEKLAYESLPIKNTRTFNRILTYINKLNYNI